jgi:hypothetical protein
VDDEHILAFIETVHRTDLDAVHVFALNAALIDDIGHSALQAPASGAAYRNQI